MHKTRFNAVMELRLDFGRTVGWSLIDTGTTDDDPAEAGAVVVAIPFFFAKR